MPNIVNVIELGNFQINGNRVQANELLKWDTFTDVYSLKYARPNTKKILQSFAFPNFRWNKEYIKSRFALAEKYASQADYLIFLMQEEIYQPIASTGFQRVPIDSANGSSYDLEGVTIPAMPNAGSGAYFLALLKAWVALCKRLGKGAALCGSPAVSSDEKIWPWIYGKSGMDYTAANFDMIYLYKYPPSVTLAKSGNYSAKSYIEFWRRKGFRGLINYIITTHFPDRAFSPSLDTIRADFECAANAGADIISTYPYANGERTNTDAVPRMIEIYKEYLKKNDTKPNTNGDKNRMTIAFFGDSHVGDFSNGITELTKDLNNMMLQSPTGKVNAIIALGDMEPVMKWDQAHKSSDAKDIPAYFVVGNHDVGTINQIKTLQGTKYPVNPGPVGTEKTSFSIEIGDIHLVILNLYWDGKSNEGWLGGGNGGGEVGSKVLAWLKSDLAVATTRYKIVCGHEPMYPDKRHVGNSLDWNKGARDALQKVLNDAGVDMFIAGHTHYARADKVGGVLQVQAGVSGAKANTNGDKFASIWFVHIAENGDLVITWKHDSGNSWVVPVVKSWTLPQGSMPPPPIVTNMTPEELALHINYVAVQGKIYDMSASPTWGKGAHQGHIGGKDMTVALMSEHSINKIKPFPVIGNLIEPPKPENPNLVFNGGFEKGTVLGWQMIERNGNKPSWSSGHHAEGCRSIKINVSGNIPTDSGYPQSEPIKVESGKTYIAKAWGKTDGCGGNAPCVRVVEMDINMGIIQTNNILPVFGKGNNDWQQRILEFTTTTQTAYVYFYADIWQGFGTFWLDDVELRLK